ncbi:MAG: cupin [Nitriliruptorales bacterium]|nr:cupin [Nitriliruptorales bacterium]
MTPLKPQGHGRSPSTPGALARCVGDPGRFLAERWGKRAHLHQGVTVEGLLGVDDVDHILATMALRAPALRVIREGRTLDQSAYTRHARIGSRTVTDLIDVGRVYGHFAEGATIVLQGLHRYWHPVSDLCRQLEHELTHPLQANAYITPPVAQGLRVHADTHDVFALQTHGRKQWVVYEGDQAPGPDGSDGVPTLDAQLWPADCLYLPKGTHHAARTVDSASIHLTLGVRTITWGDVLRPAIDRAVAEVNPDEPLPAGFAHDPGGVAEEAARRLTDLAGAIGQADASATVADAGRRFWTSRNPSYSGRLHQLLVAGDVYDRTVVRRRPGSTCEIRTVGRHVEIVLRDRTLRMPAAVEPAVRAAVGAERFEVGDLREHLDEAGRVTLVQRLIRDGLLIVVDE